jgi:hypothetical protein
MSASRHDRVGAPASDRAPGGGHQVFNFVRVWTKGARACARGAGLRPTDGIGVGRPQGLGRGILRMPADQSPVTFLPAGGPD